MRSMAARASSVVLAFLVLGLARSATAVTITMNGNGVHDRDEWGIAPLANNSSYPYENGDWTPKNGITCVKSVGTLSPGGGGHPFDAEAAYFTYDSTYAYFAVVAGIPPGGSVYGGYHYYPGDLFIKVGSNWNHAIITSPYGASSEPQFDGHVGNKTGYLYDITALDVDYKNPPPPGAGGYPQAGPTWVIGGTPHQLATDSFFYTTILDAGANSHYLIEARVPLTSLGLENGGDVTMHWTQACGNDLIELTASIPSCPPPVIPEPATCTLLGAGVLAMLAARLRRRKEQQAKAMNS